VGGCPIYVFLLTWQTTTPHLLPLCVLAQTNPLNLGLIGLTLNLLIAFSFLFLCRRRLFTPPRAPWAAVLFMSPTRRGNYDAPSPLLCVLPVETERERKHEREARRGTDATGNRDTTGDGPAHRGPAQRGGPRRGPTTGGEGHTGDPHRTHTDRNESTQPICLFCVGGVSTRRRARRRRLPYLRLRRAGQA